MKAAVLLATVLAAAVAGCKSTPRFKEPLKVAGGQSIAPEILNQGHESYMLYCYACHGEKGDGNGPAAAGMRPPPRDLGTGVFKFAGVRAGELPHDDDLMALLAHGLDGTPMLPWDLSDRERHAIVQYLKTFSERWKTEAPGEKVLPDTPDPWAGRMAEAVQTGETIYHLTGVEMDPVTQQPRAVLAGCNTCHPSYLTAQELNALSQRVLGRPAEIRDDPYRPALKESEFRVGGKPIGVMPTDFLFHRIKNGTSPEALFRTIAAGVGGTAMPTWKGAVKDEDLWALVHYVRGLARMRDTPEGAALSSRLQGRKP